MQDGVTVMVMEYLASPSLEEHMRATRQLALPLPEIKALLLRPALAALTYLHAQGIVHHSVSSRCLKLVTGPAAAKLCNIRVSGQRAAATRAAIAAAGRDSDVVIDADRAGEASMVMSASCKSPAARGRLLSLVDVAKVMPLDPPEIFSAELHSTAVRGQTGKADIWALGLSMFELLTGRSVFVPPPLHTHPYHHIQGFPRMYIDFPVDVPERARLFVLRMLAINPLLRPSAAALMIDPWLVEGYQEQEETQQEEEAVGSGGAEVGDGSTRTWLGQGSEGSSGPGQGGASHGDHGQGPQAPGSDEQGPTESGTEGGPSRSPPACPDAHPSGQLNPSAIGTPAAHAPAEGEGTHLPGRGYTCSYAALSGSALATLTSEPARFSPCSPSCSSSPRSPFPANSLHEEILHKRHSDTASLELEPMAGSLSPECQQPARGHAHRMPAVQFASSPQQSLIGHHGLFGVGPNKEQTDMSKRAALPRASVQPPQVLAAVAEQHSSGQRSASESVDWSQRVDPVAVHVQGETAPVPLSTLAKFMVLDSSSSSALCISTGDVSQHANAVVGGTNPVATLHTLAPAAPSPRTTWETFQIPVHRPCVEVANASHWTGWQKHQGATSWVASSIGEADDELPTAIDRSFNPDKGRRTLGFTEMWLQTFDPRNTISVGSGLRDSIRGRNSPFLRGLGACGSGEHSTGLAGLAYPLGSNGSLRHDALRVNGPCAYVSQPSSACVCSRAVCTTAGSCAPVFVESLEGHSPPGRCCGCSLPEWPPLDDTEFSRHNTSHSCNTGAANQVVRRRSDSIAAEWALATGSGEGMPVGLCVGERDRAKGGSSASGPYQSSICVGSADCGKLAASMSEKQQVRLAAHMAGQRACDADTPRKKGKGWHTSAGCLRCAFAMPTIFGCCSPRLRAFSGAKEKQECHARRHVHTVTERPDVFSIVSNKCQALDDVAA
jgi:serine/threonine protein kinase